MSREFRPVFVEEMNLLGFDRHWRYDPDYRGIYMLATKNSYYIGGTKVAVVRGGKIGVDPVLIPTWLPGARITPMDELPPAKKGLSLAELEDRAVARSDEVLCTTKFEFAYMGFSGGKDSLVMCHLLGRHFPAVPMSFADTGMEFPQTYEIAEWMKAWCLAHGVSFRTVSPALPVEEAWNRFGPPSKAIRWCCSVCKSAPQQNSIRHLLGRPDSVTMGITGVRNAESPRRAKYSDLSFSQKIRGQWAFHPILSWSSLDVWRYIFEHGLPIHDGYRHGLNRIGCVVCPMSNSARPEWLASKLAPETVNRFLKLTADNLAPVLKPGYTLETFVRSGNWKFRVDSTMVKNKTDNYASTETEDGLELHISNMTTDWKQWAKTVVVPFKYSVTESDDGMTIKIPSSAKKEHRIEYHRLVKVFRKATNCIACGACEASCPHGAISFTHDRQVKIHGCRQCGQCMTVDQGCLRFKSASADTAKRNGLF